MESDLAFPDPWAKPINMLRQGRQIAGMSQLEAAIYDSGINWNKELLTSPLLQTVFGIYLGWCARLEREPAYGLTLDDLVVLDSIAKHAMEIIGSGRDGELLLKKVLPGYAYNPLEYTASGAAHFDRDIVRRLVEDFWRELILFVRHIGESTTGPIKDQQAVFADFSRRFEEKNQAIAALMPSEQSGLFLRMIEEEDNACFEEHQNNRTALYRRLGLNLPDRRRSWAWPKVVYQRQSLGEMAVRTAVRATIWESIYSVFRLFR